MFGLSCTSYKIHILKNTLLYVVNKGILYSKYANANGKGEEKFSKSCPGYSLTYFNKVIMTLSSLPCHNISPSKSTSPCFLALIRIPTTLSEIRTYLSKSSPKVTWILPSGRGLAIDSMMKHMSLISRWMWASALLALSAVLVPSFGWPYPSSPLCRRVDMASSWSNSSLKGFSFCVMMCWSAHSCHLSLRLCTALHFLRALLRASSLSRLALKDTETHLSLASPFLMHFCCLLVSAVTGLLCFWDELESTRWHEFTTSKLVL